MQIQVPSNEILSSLKRWRREMYPPSPRTLQLMAEQCQQPECRRLLEYDLGTINTTTIMDDEGNAIPIAHILMARKTENSYIAVLNSFRAAVINGESIAMIMTDFEQALRNACRRAFPRALITGCSVHYDRAILKKVKALHLTPIIRQNNDAKLFLKKIMALAYLPATKISNEYATLKNALPATLQRPFRLFFRYYESQWLGKVKPTGFSVFRLSRRTNNVIESYNSILKDQMGQHPLAWDFIAWNKLISREITTAEFLNLTANLKGHIDQALMRLPEENSEDEVPLEERPEVIVIGKI
ncbi:uncharacterized protein [Venturia canescens]|uniref:uncharacterized protein n=1 Tax=Venturia canescens TaxID=32260 RepID=UPI001C9D1B55|nr:uncharacterized protein LOC122416221 [Venturia canescens]